jgi:hypothetical protein
VATPTWCAELDAGALIRSLARPAPASIAFTEVRFSPLLERPLTVSGELTYSGPSHLQRLVTDPYRERTTIRGESVRVERDGESPRTFALKRAPELRGLLTGFSALLAGDSATIERNFEVEVSGDTDHWSMTLIPKEVAARKRLQQLQTFGHGNEPACFTTTSAEGARSVMLLGATPLDIDTVASAEELLARCTAAAAAQ